MLVKNKKENKKEMNIFDNIPTMADMIMPDILQEKRDYICLGYNKYSRIFVMTIYPEQTWISWLDDLFNIGNINISVKIEPSSNGNVINQLTKKLVQSQSEYATYSRQRKHITFTRTRKTNCRFRRIKNANTNQSG